MHCVQPATQNPGQKKKKKKKRRKKKKKKKKRRGDKEEPYHETSVALSFCSKDKPSSTAEQP